MAIPKVIHYCWFGKGEMTPLHKACMKTWTNHLDGYEIVRWDESNAPMGNSFVKHHYVKKNWAFVSDFVRAYAIYHYGGFYLDVDFEVLRDFEDLRKNFAFVGEELNARITNGICGAQALHPFFNNIMRFMLERHDSGKEVMISPDVCMAVYAAMKLQHQASDITIYPPDFFYPYNPFNPDPEKRFLLGNYITENTYAIHHWGHSWKSGIIKRALRKMKLILKG